MSNLVGLSIGILLGADRLKANVGHKTHDDESALMMPAITVRYQRIESTEKRSDVLEINVDFGAHNLHASISPKGFASRLFLNARMMRAKATKSTVDLRNHEESTSEINLFAASIAPKIWKFYPLI